MKARRATAKVIKTAAETGAKFELIQLGLASLKSVRAAADKLIADDRSFDVVIANGVVMATPVSTTQDGSRRDSGPIT